MPGIERIFPCSTRLYSCDDDPDEYWELFSMGIICCNFVMYVWFPCLLIHYIQCEIMSHDYVYTLVRYFIYVYRHTHTHWSRKLIIFLFIPSLSRFRRISCRSVLVNWGWATRPIAEWLAFCAGLCCLLLYCEANQW